MKKLSVKEYADLKGVSKQNILMKIKRGTLKDKVELVGLQYVISVPEEEAKTTS